MNAWLPLPQNLRELHHNLELTVVLRCLRVSSVPRPVPHGTGRVAWQTSDDKVQDVVFVGRATLEVAHDIVPNTVAFAIRMVQCASEDAPCFAVGPKETLRQGLAVGGGPDDDVDPHHLRKYVRFRNEQKS